MAKRTTAFNLSEDLIEQIKAEGPNASATAERIFREYFEQKYHRAPSDAELAEALTILFRAAQARRGEEIE